MASAMWPLLGSYFRKRAVLAPLTFGWSYGLSRYTSVAIRALRDSPARAYGMDTTA